jgi:hypothetical protein
MRNPKPVNTRSAHAVVAATDAVEWPAALTLFGEVLTGVVDIGTVEHPTIKPSAETVWICRRIAAPPWPARKGRIPPSASGIGERNRHAKLGIHTIADLYGPEPEKPASGPTAERSFTPAFSVYVVRHTCATLALLDGVDLFVVESPAQVERGPEATRAISLRAPRAHSDPVDSQAGFFLPVERAGCDR